MKVILITSKLRFEENGSPIGGSVVDLHLKAKGLAELGHEVSVVTAFSEANKLFSPLPYKVYERQIPSRTLFGLQRGVYKLLKEFEDKTDRFYIDGHIFLYGGGAYRVLGGTVPTVGFFNVRLNVWADASGNVAYPSFFRRIKKKLRSFLERTIGALLANRLDAFLFNTPQVQKMYHDFGIAKKKPNAIIQDFIATRELMQRFAITEECIKMHQEKASPVILLATGRMIPEKGFDLLLRAFASIGEKEHYRLILSGGGPDKERLERLSETLGLLPFVEFPGWVPRERLYQFFKEAHIFIFPKWWIEYGSAVLTEALAFGLPSIIPGGGALEWLTAGTALTFRNDSIKELAVCIERLGRDAPLRFEYAQKALQRGEALDAATLSRRFECILTSLRNRD